MSLHYSHYLLAHGNIDFPLVSRTLNNLDPAAAFAPLQPLHDTDIEGHLRHAHEQTIISAIEEGRRSTVDTFYRTLESNMRKDWEKQKELVFEELGRHAPSASTSNSIAPTSGLRKSLGRDTGFGEVSSSPSRHMQTGVSQLQLHPKMMRYGLVTQKLNNYRKQDIPFGIINAYMDASIGGSAANDTVSSQMHFTSMKYSFHRLTHCYYSGPLSLLRPGDFSHTSLKKETS